MDKTLEVLESYLSSNAFITTKQAENLGVKKHIICELAKLGKIERVRRGLYTQPNCFADIYEFFQIGTDKAIFSYSTALYFHGLSDRIPSIFHITLPSGYNASKVKKRGDVAVHYIDKKLYDIGKCRIASPLGGNVVVYDKERCICDLIKNKSSLDSQIFVSAIQGYFSEKNKDIPKLIKYAKLFGIEKKVRVYTEVM